MKNIGPIMVLEDDIDDQELIQEVFEEIGVQENILFFKDGAAALDFLLNTKEQPFLIISDINLPVMSGLQFQKKVGESEYLRKKSIPLVFLTTVDSAEIIEQVYTLTVQGFFIKPTSYDEYKRTIHSITEYWRRCRHPNTARS